MENKMIKMFDGRSYEENRLHEICPKLLEYRKQHNVLVDVTTRKDIYPYQFPLKYLLLSALTFQMIWSIEYVSTISFEFYVDDLIYWSCMILFFIFYLYVFIFYVRIKLKILPVVIQIEEGKYYHLKNNGNRRLIGDVSQLKWFKSNMPGLGRLYPFYLFRRCYCVRRAWGSYFVLGLDPETFQIIEDFFNLIQGSSSISLTPPTKDV